MSAAEEHVHHLVRRNESLQAKIERLKAKGESVARHGVETLEICAGAAIGGLLQGMSKNPDGPKLFHVPADLGLGLGLLVAGGLEVAGKEYSDHVSNLGKGFLAAYATDFGHAVGTRKKESGSFFHKSGKTLSSGEASPQQMANAILQQMQGQPG